MSSRDPDGAPEPRPQMARAVVLVLVAVAVAVLVLRHTGSASTGLSAAAPRSTTTTTSPGGSTTTTTVKPLIPPDKITVQVLNGLRTGSLAGNLSTKLTADGYTTLPADDTTTAAKTTLIYVVDRAYYREGLALAHKLGRSGFVVRRTIPASAPIPTGIEARADLIVIIGTSLQTLASTA